MVTRLCSTKPLLTVKGEYPGPTIQVQEGDEVEIIVTNKVSLNTTIHWLASLMSLNFLESNEVIVLIKSEFCMRTACLDATYFCRLQSACC